MRNKVYLAMSIMLGLALGFVLIINIGDYPHSKKLAYDAQVKSAMNKIIIEMSDVYNAKKSYNSLMLDSPALAPIVADIKKYSYEQGGLVVTHFPAEDSSKSCLFAPLNIDNGKTWYCVDSQGATGVVSINPAQVSYCLEGISAKCPPIIAD